MDGTQEHHTAAFLAGAAGGLRAGQFGAITAKLTGDCGGGGRFGDDFAAQQDAGAADPRRAVWHDRVLSRWQVAPDLQAAGEVAVWPAVGSVGRRQSVMAGSAGNAALAQQ